MRSLIKAILFATFVIAPAAAQTPPLTEPQWQMSSDVPAWLQVRDRYGHWVTFATVGNGTLSFEGGLSFGCSTMPGLTGDVTSNPASCVTTLATMSSAGNYGAVNRIPYFAVDTKGRISNAGDNPIATDACLNAGASALSGNETVNAQTGTVYTFALADKCRLVTFNNNSAAGVTLPQAGSGAGLIPSGWWADVKNLGAGTVTITATSPSTINGQATLPLLRGAGARIISDGANYQIAGKISGAWFMATPPDPAATTSTTGIMMGLGTQCKLGPVSSGTAGIIISGSTTNNSTAGTQTIELRYGTGTPPPYNTAKAGVGAVLGKAVTVIDYAYRAGFTVQGIAPTLTQGTTYWFDVALNVGAGQSGSVQDITCTGHEF
jgi:hypothetical protein